MRNARRTNAPVARRRSFVTPEGVDLQLELGGAGTRAAAFLIDVTLMLIVMVALLFYVRNAGSQGSRQHG